MNSLVKLQAWTKTKYFKAPVSAQGYLCNSNGVVCGSSCGSSCGAGGEDNPKTSSCGASDDK